MASLEKRNGTFRVVFRFAGQKFSRSLKTTDEKSANLSLARLEDNLRRLELGTMELDAGADIPTVLLSSGAVSQRPAAVKRALFGDILDRYLASIPDSSIEATTRGMLNTHIRHLKRLIGPRTPPAALSMEKLQSYVNGRSQEKGQRGRNISAITIGKELTTLKTAWTWAKHTGYVDADLPSRSRLRFPKLDEKPPFRTWAEIERIIHPFSPD